MEKIKFSSSGESDNIYKKAFYKSVYYYYEKFLIAAIVSLLGA